MRVGGGGQRWELWDMVRGCAPFSQGNVRIGLAYVRTRMGFVTMLASINSGGSMRKGRRRMKEQRVGRAKSRKRWGHGRKETSGMGGSTGSASGRGHREERGRSGGEQDGRRRAAAAGRRRWRPAVAPGSVRVVRQGQQGKGEEKGRPRSEGDWEAAE